MTFVTVINTRIPTATKYLDNYHQCLKKRRVCNLGVVGDFIIKRLCEYQNIHIVMLQMTTMLTLLSPS